DVSQVSHVSPTVPQDPGHLYDYQCYYCDNFKTNNNDDYETHVIKKHAQSHPCYPSKADLEKLGLKVQGRSWEI
ncbi:MAG: hypothetical protein ACJ71A_00275, partial [Nitrososphaeraceae archaeon]